MASVTDGEATGAAHSEAGSAAAGTGAGADRGKAPPQLVLLVDDDEDFRSAFAETLHDDHVDTTLAPGGEAALEILERLGRTRHRFPDLILMDLMMPRMSGLEALQHLKRHPRWRSIPVMVLTGVNDPMLRVRLDVPVAYKADPDTIRRAVRQQLAR
jgi:CheY-like chemotaxis protein